MNTNNSPSSTPKEPEKCPVCIQQIAEPKSYSSGCLHTFCFECIFRWSQIKKECPLCKRPFDRIIFTVQNSLQFRECHFRYFPEETSPQVPLQIVGFIPGSNSTLTTQTEQCTPRETYSRASWVVNKEQAPIEFRMMVYLQKWHSFSHHTQSYSSINSLGEDLLDQDIDSSDSEILCCINYRRCLTFRDTTNEWYKGNPAHAYRLEPFINRELKALRVVLKQEAPKQPAHLTRDSRISLTNKIIERVQECWINSEEFLDMLKEFIRPCQFAEHFQHELYNYARSVSYTLTDYDAKCVYYSSQFPSKVVESSPPSALSINLNKYRLLSKPNNEPVELGLGNVQTTQSFITINDNNEQMINNEHSSDHSSFCEEVEVTPQQSPSYIVISSASSSSSRSKPRHSSPSNRSKKRKKSKKKSKKRVKSISPSKRSRQRSRSRSLSFSRSSRYRTRSRTKSRSISSSRRPRHRSRSRSLSIPISQSLRTKSRLISSSRTRSRSIYRPRHRTRSNSSTNAPKTSKSKKSKKFKKSKKEKKSHRHHEPC